MTSMGERIKKVRQLRGFTQEELGEKIGVQKSAIAKYENGRVSNLKRTIIHELAKALNVSPAWLMGFDDSSDPADAIPPYTDYSAAAKMRQELIELVQSVPEEQTERVLRIMKAILAEGDAE